ncbi:hypothetical protein [Facilibium subflavum]|uniref:hypothetical protein n=1 Tax=Facilibium subflavum TaxID=2219058 RepID=UPI000E65BCA1|nr:hypothetical protein [Facilibium subflavum]
MRHPIKIFKTTAESIERSLKNLTDKGKAHRFNILLDHDKLLTALIYSDKTDLLNELFMTCNQDKLYDAMRRNKNLLNSVIKNNKLPCLINNISIETLGKIARLPVAKFSSLQSYLEKEQTTAESIERLFTNLTGHEKANRFNRLLDDDALLETLLIHSNKIDLLNELFMTCNQDKLYNAMRRNKNLLRSLIRNNKLLCLVNNISIETLGKIAQLPVANYSLLQFCLEKGQINMFEMIANNLLKNSQTDFLYSPNPKGYSLLQYMAEKPEHSTLLMKLMYALPDNAYNNLFTTTFSNGNTLLHDLAAFNPEIITPLLERINKKHTTLITKTNSNKKNVIDILKDKGDLKLINQLLNRFTQDNKMFVDIITKKGNDSLINNFFYDELNSLKLSLSYRSEFGFPLRMNNSKKKLQKIRSDVEHKTSRYSTKIIEKSFFPSQISTLKNNEAIIKEWLKRLIIEAIDIALENRKNRHNRLDMKSKALLLLKQQTQALPNNTLITEIQKKALQVERILSHHTSRFRFRKLSYQQALKDNFKLSKYNETSMPKSYIHTKEHIDRIRELLFLKNPEQNLKNSSAPPLIYTYKQFVKTYKADLKCISESSPST